MFQTTVGDLAESLGIDYAAAAAIVKIATAKGLAKEVGKRPTATGKGKPATIYELPHTITLTLSQAAAA